MSLNFELVKHCTSLCRLSHLDELMTRMTGVDTEVWALRADNFPEHLVPQNSRNYLCYMGVFKEKLDTQLRDCQFHFLTFGHENFLGDGSASISGVLEYMYDLYCEHIRIINDQEEVYLYPLEIDEESIEYWSDIAKKTWNIKEKKQLVDFIENNELADWVNWSGLAEHLPDVYYPSESEHHTDSESETDSDSETESESETDSDSETEDGEIKDDEDEPPRKRRKYAYSDSDEDEA